MKKALTLLTSAALMVSLAACGGGGGTGEQTSTGGATPAPKAPEVKQEAKKDPVTLRMAWWGGQPRHDYTIKVIEMYQQKNPHVKIEYEYASFDDYWKKLAPQAAANNLPDVFQMDLSYLAQYGGKNQLADLTPLTKSGALDVSDVSESALSGGLLNGKLYGMNLGVNAMGLIINPDLLQKAGLKVPEASWTWDDVEKYAAELKKTNVKLSNIPVPEQFFSYYLRTQGQTLFSKDGTQLGYTDDKLFVDYFNRIDRLAKAGSLPTPDESKQVKGVEDGHLAKKQVAIGWNYSNQLVQEQSVLKDVQLTLAPLPGPNGNKGLFMKPSMYFSIAESSKNKEEAAKFISFFINDIEANKLIKGDRGVPVAGKVKEALKPLLTPENQKVFDYVAWADKNSSPIDPPDPVGSAEITKLLRDMQDQIQYGKATPADLAAKFRTQANEILGKNKK
jgi:multiple sugar transport system substrate-binding protein